MHSQLQLSEADAHQNLCKVTSFPRRKTPLYSQRNSLWLDASTRNQKLAMANDRQTKTYRPKVGELFKVIVEVKFSRTALSKNDWNCSSET
jgi:hypothetical protein